MNNEKTRNDFIFFQNEILGDVKKVETKLSEKLSQTTSFLETQTQKYEQKLKDLANRFNILSHQLEEHNNTEKFEEVMKQSKQKLEDLVTKIEVKLNILDKDFNNACFKYDKIFSNNLVVPGLIGAGCPYDTLKPFLEYTNQKLGELLKAKEKQTIDTKKYKEKMENLISHNKTQFETAQNKISDYCSHGFQQCDIICKDRMNLIEKRIESLRLENGQYSIELKQKADELQIEWDKLNKIDNTLSRKYKDEWNKFNDIVDKLSNKMDKYKEEFFVIKNRFNELNDLIKDVRFRRNMSDMNSVFSEIPIEKVGRKQHKELSTRNDFSKKRKRTTKRQNSNFYPLNENNDNEALGPYEHYNINQNLLESNRDIKFENTINYNSNKLNINESPSNNNNEIRINSKDSEMKLILNENTKEDKNKIDINNQRKKIKKLSKFNVQNNLNIPESSINKNKSSTKINDIFQNKSSEFQSVSSNFMSNINDLKPEKKQDIKFINIKSKNNNQINNYNLNDNDNNTSHIINYNKDNNTYTIINYNNNFNNKGSNTIYNNDINSQKTLERINLNDSKEQTKNNFLFLSENAKINDLVLGADFSGNNLYRINGPTYNLSQAYLLIKRRNEEIQKIRKNGKSEPKNNQLTPVISHSRNFNNYNNFYLSKKHNKEDLYYSSLRKDKFKSIGINQNINLNLTNQENPEKNNFPKIFKENKKLTKYTSMDKNNLFSSYVNEVNKKNFNSSNHTIVDYNSININDNSFDEKLSKKHEKSRKKLLYSISEKNMPFKLSPITPNYKNFSIGNIDEKKEGKAKEALNHIKPYLIKKFRDE